MPGARSEVVFAASPKVRSPGQCCRVKLRTISGIVNLNCRKNCNISTEEKADLIYGQLPDLPDWREAQRITATGSEDSDYFSLPPDYSVYEFWSELKDIEFDEGGSCELPDYPEMDADFDLWSSIGDDDLKFADAEDFGEELKVWEVEKEMKWMDFLNPCSFHNFDDQNMQMVPLPLGSQEPDSENVKVELNSESSKEFSSSMQLLSDDDAKIVSSGDGMMFKKASTSARSHKKTRLNPAVARSFGASFKLQKSSAERDSVQKTFRYEDLECSEVLSESDSEGESVETPQVKPSAKRPKKKIGGLITRNQLPEQAVSVMKAWMDKHMSNPYATKEEKLELVKLSGLTLHQVENWLSNTRYRLKIHKARRSATTEDAEDTSSNPVRKTLVARNKKKYFFLW